ncbi:MAG: Re/Si-specific NAD(P)(+) transhydrogenase subunit alpha [archaeon]
MAKSKGGARVFIPCEPQEGERRAAATPASVKGLITLGLVVTIEKDAGKEAGFSDDEYKKAGAAIATDTAKGYTDADIVLAVNAPSSHPDTKLNQGDMIKPGAWWVSFLIPQTDKDAVNTLSRRRSTCFSMNLVPRISRAQKMDALSSQSNIAGYKAVMLAADALDKVMPLMMTAAGTINPAKVVILGAGVAGLQAIATARRLGAKVEASDIRSAVKEQVESLGAKFIDVPTDENAEDKGGYAKEASKDYLKRQAEEVGRRLAQADIAITTALIPGRRAPLLITAEMVKSMPQGSVIVDLAAVAGGNCELTFPGKTIQKHGVTIIGETNIPALVPFHSTQMYANNMLAFVQSIVKDGVLSIDKTDEVVRDSMVLEEGKEPTKETVTEARPTPKKRPATKGGGKR